MKHRIALKTGRSLASALLALSLAACTSTNQKPHYDIESVASEKGTEVFQPSWENIAGHYQFPEWFRDGKFGIFIHWGVYSVPAFGSEWYPRNMYLKDSPEYNFAKICVNSIFGACAQKTVREKYEITTESGLIVDKKSWYAHMEEMKDEEIIKTQTRTGKLPFMWGLWTASCTRLELHKLQKLIGWDKCIYWDTDSIKYRGKKPSSILEYNKAQEILVKDRGAIVINRNGKPVYIGVAEDEHPGEEYGYSKFRFLHSKCYAYEEKTGITAVIAGVTKKAGKRALNGSVDNLINGLYIYPAGGQKLWYHPRPLQPDGRASYIYMQDRDVTIGKADRGKFEGETVY